MNLKNFIKLKKLSEIILKKNKNNRNILSIRQLQIMRPHPVFLKDYDDSYDEESKKIDSKNLFQKLLDFFITYFSESHAYYTDYNFNKLNRKTQKKKILFLTHLINIKHINKNTDFYFGKLINKLKKNNYNTCTVFRNFTSYPSKDVFKKNKNFFRSNIILSKSLNFFQEIILISKIFITYLNLKKLEISNSKESIFFQNKNLLKFSGSVYNNLKLLFQFDEVISNFNPKFIFLTLEGHSWERVLINHIRTKYSNIVIISYQFSILTKHSSSIYLNLGKNFSPDIILTSGNYSKKEIKKKLDLKIKYINIGSNKFYPANLKEKKNSNILIIPEGFNSETLKMLEFTIEAAKILKNKIFIFRFHPMIDKNFFFQNFSINLIFSKNTFLQDIKETKYVIYRGSAASIQALSSGSIPIYFKFQNEINIDPLFMMRNKFYVSNVSDFIKILDNKRIVNLNKKNILFTQEYFDKPDFNPLIKYLKRIK